MKIFEIYTDEIGPYAIELVNNLIDLFKKLYDKEMKLDKMSNKTEDIMDTGFSLQACLTALGEILQSKIDQASLEQIMDNLEPVLSLSFTPDGLEYVAETSAIFSCI